MVNSIGLPSVIFLVNNIVSTFLFCWWIPSFYILRATNCWKMSRMFGSRSWVKRRVSRVVLYFSTCSWCWNYPNKKSIKQEIITRLVKISFKDYARFWSNIIEMEPESQTSLVFKFLKAVQSPNGPLSSFYIKKWKTKKWITVGIRNPDVSGFRMVDLDPVFEWYISLDRFLNK